MTRRIVLLLAIVAIAATAGTVPGLLGKYRITLTEPSVVQGTELKAGEYQLNLTSEKVAFFAGKNQVAEVPVKIENVESKFERTAIRTQQLNGKQSIAEIRLGGTKVRLMFNP